MKSSGDEQERIAFARAQRQQSNEFAQDVWQLVRGRKILGEKFRREHPIGPFTLDFACLELKLDLEIDGKDHLTQAGQLRDKRRDAYLRRLGFTILRIRGYRVLHEREAVKSQIEEIIRQLRSQSPSPPPPLPEAGRGEPG